MQPEFEKKRIVKCLVKLSGDWSEFPEVLFLTPHFFLVWKGIKVKHHGKRSSELEKLEEMGNRNRLCVTIKLSLKLRFRELHWYNFLLNSMNDQGCKL